MKKLPILIMLAAFTVLAACSKKEAEKPVEKFVNITTAVAKKKDLQIVESAVGSASSLGFAQALDPTRVQAGTFTIRLPFPAQVARQLRIGQNVRLTSFDNPDKVANGYVKEIHPALDNTTQSMEVIVELRGGREWYSIGSVRGDVVLGVRHGAVVVPEQAVVLRPAGSVVYVAEDDVVKERVVQQGLQRDGEIEILAGLKAGEIVAVDGAALLSDGAKVKTHETAAPVSISNNGKKKP
jgi:hypothetical protein